MVFKLVRTDSEEPCKIQLPSGTHLIGRGKFLDCDDKRVSRNHGELEVVDDTIVMRALHQNPCFYIKKGSEEAQILKQACTINLSNGDKFGLLPNSFWFEVLHCASVDVSRSPEKASEENTEPLDQTLIGTETTQNHLIVENNPDDEQPDNHEKDDATADSQVTESQSILSPAAVEAGSPSLNPRETSPNRNEDNRPDVSDPPAMQVPSSTSDPADQSNQVPKRCLSPVDSKDEIKKIKTEPEVKQEPDVKPGPSGDQGSSTNPPTNNNTNMIPGVPASPAKPAAAPGRERCMYGANCYRRNPQHKVQFAHPSDADWGAGARGVCPYGAACRKRDSRHWRDHDHPPGVQPPPPPPPNAPAQRPVKKRSKRRESESDQSDSDGDTPQASLIVTGKRSRKKVARPSHSGSEFEDDEEDPFGTDDEDEWVPGSQSQYTQDTQDD